MNSEKFLSFYIKILSNIDSKDKNLKIETSLTHSKYLNTLNEFNELEKTKVIIDDGCSCKLCDKGFFNSNFIFIFPDKLFHTECYHETYFEKN